MIQATIEATCQECQHTFSPQDGGICGRCGRLLCGRHLHGWLGSLRGWWREARRPDSEGPVCARCRRSNGRD